ncbi:LOW QUALITY PROTEIN: arginine--tRNA ligase, cytoplasmic-like [Paramacrobiotus metropolitanus]|uniref:LOW QUALITY PROTEIN: arginine--tRNA ligase, cytoplasmic-like n=1 Tax=Paramacrobiotus metropolitanus TaxID=2943436 RepID=UPI002445BE6C|nr:LOW QUALITY PROTEIN: arginine--tRNA ligase, cytoplasmic-like [Paramacrobiotus metropolitanus]
MDSVPTAAVAERTLAQEKETAGLEQQVADMKRSVDALANDGSSGDMESLSDTNARLKFRMAHLQKALESRESQASAESHTTRKRLEALFHVAVLSCYPNIEEIPNAVNACDPRHGDYQCNDAMQICQWLKKQGINEKPNLIAQKLLDNLPKNNLIASSKVAPAGFINVDLNKEYVADQLTDLVKKNYPPPTLPKKQRVVVDYSSPNIAKEMHVGHLRSTIIGDSIANMLEFAGHDVLRLNHLGDWGTQFGMLIAHLEEQFPDYLTVSPPIGDLQAFYKESKKRFDEDAEFKKRAYNRVVQLQSHVPEITKAWQLIVSVSYQEFTKVYERLSTSKKLQNRGESFYQDHMVDLVKELDGKGQMTEEEGRKLLFVPGGQIPLTIVKSDGGFTYDTSDLACIKHRLQVEKCDRNLYVIDSGQELHINLIIKAAEFLGFSKPEQLSQFVGFGLVLGEDKKKFKTRSGDTVRLVDLLDEGVNRAAAKLKDKGRDKDLTTEEFEAARDAVAYGCIKYADLSNNRTSDYVFSFDKMLDDKGNTAVYLLYAYTRIRAISRNAGVSPDSLKAYVESVEQLPLDHAKELKLAKKLIQFHEMLLTVMDNLLMNQLCDYMYQLSGVFTEFYDNCYCIEKDRKSGEVLKIHMHRLALCEATAGVMDRCFQILGIKPVGKM